MAKKLIEIAQILRSKNAGPLFITFDIMFDNHEDLITVLNSHALNETIIAELYNVD